MHTILEPVFISVGACIFFVILVIFAIALYYYVGLVLAAFVIRVALPALLLGGMCMCLFAFLGWATGCPRAIMKAFLFTGGLLGIILELCLFGIAEPPEVTKRFLY